MNTNIFGDFQICISVPLNTSSDQVPSIEFLLKSLTLNKSILEQESKYLNSISVLPFFISFFCWNEINKKSSVKEVTRKIENYKAIKEYTRKMGHCKANNVPEKRFLQKLLEIGWLLCKKHLKVSLIAVPWILLISKILYQNIRKFVRKYRSSRPEVFCKKGVLRSFPRFTGNSRAPVVPASKNQYNKCGAGLQPGTYFTRSFIF